MFRGELQLDTEKQPTPAQQSTINVQQYLYLHSVLDQQATTHIESVSIPLNIPEKEVRKRIVNNLEGMYYGESNGIESDEEHEILGQLLDRTVPLLEEHYTELQSKAHLITKKERLGTLLKASYRFAKLEESHRTRMLEAAGYSPQDVEGFLKPVKSAKLHAGVAVGSAAMLAGAQFLKYRMGILSDSDTENIMLSYGMNYGAAGATGVQNYRLMDHENIGYCANVFAHGAYHLSQKLIPDLPVVQKTFVAGANISTSAASEILWAGNAAALNPEWTVARNYAGAAWNVLQSAGSEMYLRVKSNNQSE